MARIFSADSVVYRYSRAILRCADQDHAEGRPFGVVGWLLGNGCVGITNVVTGRWFIVLGFVQL
jgi:hypothetical protein